MTRSLAIRTRRADFGFAPSRSASSRRSGVLHLGEVADIVESVLYLERAKFVTGETLHIDGGRQPDTDAGSDDDCSLATVDALLRH